MGCPKNTHHTPDTHVHRRERGESSVCNFSLVLEWGLTMLCRLASNSWALAISPPSLPSSSRDHRHTQPRQHFFRLDPEC